MPLFGPKSDSKNFLLKQTQGVNTAFEDQKHRSAELRAVAAKEKTSGGRHHWSNGVEAMGLFRKVFFREKMGQVVMIGSKHAQTIEFGKKARKMDEKKNLLLLFSFAW